MRVLAPENSKAMYTQKPWYGAVPVLDYAPDNCRQKKFTLHRLWTFSITDFLQNETCHSDLVERHETTYRVP